MPYPIYDIGMKRFKLIIIVVAFIAGVALSSCTHKLCPAYADADADTEQVDPSS